MFFSISIRKKLAEFQINLPKDGLIQSGISCRLGFSLFQDGGRCYDVCEISQYETKLNSYPEKAKDFVYFIIRVK